MTTSLRARLTDGREMTITSEDRLDEFRTQFGSFLALSDRVTLAKNGDFILCEPVFALVSAPADPTTRQPRFQFVQQHARRVTLRRDVVAVRLEGTQYGFESPQPPTLKTVEPPSGGCGCAKTDIIRAIEDARDQRPAA